MKNGITVKGVEYKSVRVTTTVVFDNVCEKCDLRRICEKTGVQYPCGIFSGLTYFKRLKNENKH